MPQDKDELLQVLITKYAQMYMKLAYAIGVPYDDVEDIVMEAFWSFYRADYGGKLESEKAIKVVLRVLSRINVSTILEKRSEASSRMRTKM